MKNSIIKHDNWGSQNVIIAFLRGSLVEKIVKNRNKIERNQQIIDRVNRKKSEKMKRSKLF